MHLRIYTTNRYLQSKIRSNYSVKLKSIYAEAYVPLSTLRMLGEKYFSILGVSKYIVYVSLRRIRQKSMRAHKKNQK